MVKYQEFNGFRTFSVYHKAEKVWTSDFCEPYEWDSEEKMRLDMLIHHHAENEKEEMQFQLWDCRTEDEFLARHESYTYQINQ